jgi:flagellar hook-associated protein 3 FlgL
MAGRITQSMMNIQLQRNLNNNLMTMSKYQEQMATSRKINKPSDDPVGMSYALRYRSELAATDQYQENVDSSVSWLDFTDTMLNQAGDVLNRVRELAVQGANGSNSVSALDAIKKEVVQLTQQLVTIGNSQFNGKHVFNGQVTDAAPYSNMIERDPLSNNAYVVQAKNSSTDSAEINYEIATGVRMAVNVPGDRIFGNPAEPDNFFNIMEKLINGLDQGNLQGISSTIGNFDSRMDKFLGVRSDVGAKINRISLSEDRLKDISTNLQALQSKTEDVDMAELITNMKTNENVYQASLSVGSRIITPSLLDFLK